MRILLAPMEGLLDFLLRDTITRVGGIDLCVSEFIRINDTLLPAHRFYKVVPELENQCRTTSSVPVRVQLLGSDPICIADNAAKVASLGASGIDLNFGCPAPTVNRNRGGAVLLKEPKLLYDIVQAVRRAVPQNVSVTAKMRLGFDSTELALVCAKALEEGGAEEIVVHARTKTDGYKPPAYWEWIAKIQESARIPIVANGEIWNAEDAKRCQEISGCQDLMIGRGAISNPALALMIRGQLANPLPWDEIVQLLVHFYTRMQTFIPGKNQAGRIKQWLHYLSRQYPEAEESFARVKRITKSEEIINSIRMRQPDNSNSFSNYQSIR